MEAAIQQKNYLPTCRYSFSSNKEMHKYQSCMLRKCPDLKNCYSFQENPVTIIRAILIAYFGTETESDEKTFSVRSFGYCGRSEALSLIEIWGVGVGENS